MKEGFIPSAELVKLNNSPGKKFVTVVNHS